MSRSIRGNKGAGYEYGPRRWGKCFAAPGAETKRFTHKRERLRNRRTARIELHTFEIERHDPPLLTDWEQFMEDLYRDECAEDLFDDFFREEEEERLREEDERNLAYESLADDWDWASEYRPN